MPGQNKESTNLAVRYAGLGLELAGGVLGFALFGWWIDRHFETSPWGLLTCAVLGLIGGLYNLVRASLRAIKPSTGTKPRADEDERS